MALIQNPLYLLSQIRKKFPEAEKEDWILRLDDRPKHKRNCVVCVARRSSETEGVVDDSKTSMFSFTLNPSHTIVSAQFRDSHIGIDPSDVVGHCVDELCCKDDKSVLDTLLDSVTECSAELHLCIKKQLITTRAHTVKTSNAEQPILLECAIMRLKTCSSSESLEHSPQRVCDVPTEAPRDVSSLPETPSALEDRSCAPTDPINPPRFTTISPPNSSSATAETEVEGPSDALSQLCTKIFSEHSDVAGVYGEQSGSNVNASMPPYDCYPDQLYYAPCSSTMAPPSMFVAEYPPGEPQALPLPPPSVSDVKVGRAKKPRKPRQPKSENSSQRSRAQKRKGSAIESSTGRAAGSSEGSIAAGLPGTTGPDPPPPVSYQPQMWEYQQYPPPNTHSPYSVETPKPRHTLLKSLLEPSPNEQLCLSRGSSSGQQTPLSAPSATVTPHGGSAPSSDTQPAYSFRDSLNERTQRDSCVSASSSGSSLVAMYQPVQVAPSESLVSPAFMPSSISSTPINTLYGSPLSPSACCSYLESSCGPSSGDCSATSFDGVQSTSMVPSGSAGGVSMSTASLDGTMPPASTMSAMPTMHLQQQRGGPPLVHQQPHSMRPNSQQWTSTAPATAPAAVPSPSYDYMYQQNSSGMYTQMGGMSQQVKASPLKRKPTVPQGVSELPPKLAHMNTSYAYQASPQYVQQQPQHPQQQQQSVPSGQFPQTPSAPSNRLSPYSSYEGAGNGGMGSMGTMGQWGKRPPSRSELIRMELRHSVQARQHAASPNHSMPNNGPRFPSVGYGQMASPRMPHSPSMPTSTMHNDGGQMLHSTGSTSLSVQPPYYVPQQQDALPSPDFASPISSSHANDTVPQPPVMPTELYDFNLENGRFDMDSDATRSLVQQLLS